MPSRAPATATRGSSASTRSSRPARTPARSCTSVCARARRTRGALRFADELLARVRQAGAAGPILLRAGSGFWSKKVAARLREQGCRYSIGVTMHKIITMRIALIPETAWQPVADYPDSGVCELAETTLGEDRLIVRRVHLHAQEDQAELFTYWRHHAFVTDRSEPMHDVDAEHRQHAQVELVIRDLKDQALAHFPSGHYSANSARTVIACLAHNLGRRTNLLGLTDPTPRAARTLRRRLFALPGRLTRTARLDAASPRPLALADRLHRSAHPHPSAPRRLTRHRQRPRLNPRHRRRSRLPKHRPADPPNARRALAPLPTRSDTPTLASTSPSPSHKTTQPFTAPSQTVDRGLALRRRLL